MSQRTFALNRRAALEGDADSGDYVLVDTHSATLCACNESAWRILKTLKKGATLGDLEIADAAGAGKTEFRQFDGDGQAGLAGFRARCQGVH